MKCRSVSSRAGGDGGLSVTNICLDRAGSVGRFWSRLTQYVAHTESFSGSRLPRVPFKQFQLAHAARFCGMSPRSECRYTSFGWYLTAPSVARSASVASSPRIARAWSE